MKRKTSVFLFVALLTACGEKQNAENKLRAIVSPSDIHPKQVIGTGKIEPQSGISKLAAGSAGLVTAVYKTAGDTVRKGQVIVQLDDLIERLHILQVRSQISEQLNQVDIQNAELETGVLKANDKARLLASTKNLFAKGSATRQEQDDLETENQILSVAMQKGKSAVNSARSKLAELYAQLKTAKAELNKKALRAPSDGMILDVPVKIGSALSQYAMFAEFAPAGKIMVRAEIDELFSEKLKMGQQVVVRYQGTYKEQAHGQITFISPGLKRKSLFSEMAGDQEDRRVREIKVSLDKGNTFIINSKVECIINLVNKGS